MDFIGGGGFDWNGNRKSNAFDNYMDMKVSGSDNSDSDESGTSVSPTSTRKKTGNSNDKKLKGISTGGKPLYDATKDSNGITILKCLLATALCIGGIVLPVAADIGTLGTLICIFSAIGLSILILKNI